MNLIVSRPAILLLWFHTHNAFAFHLAPLSLSSRSPTTKFGGKIRLASSSSSSSNHVNGNSNSNNNNSNNNDDDDDDVDSDKNLLRDLRAMPIRQLKAELPCFGISTHGMFEKEEMVQSLFKAIVEIERVKKARELLEPPIVTSLILNKEYVPRVRISADGLHEIQSQPQDKPYVGIRVHAFERGAAFGQTFPLNILLDTACTDIVLRPELANKLGMIDDFPITVTGAGGKRESRPVTVLSFRLGEEEFGPFPAALQNVDALPDVYDGIVGLSFLSLFGCVEFDFRKEQLVLYKTERRPNFPRDLRVASDTVMEISERLEMYVTYVQFGGKGPVRMVVDSGGSRTLLNWRGLASLSLTRDSPHVEPVPAASSMIMGGDNLALKVSHQIHVSSNFNLGGSGKNDFPHGGISLKNARLRVGIGEIGIIEPEDDLGGVLGIDALARSPMVRLNFTGGPPRITLFYQIPV